MDLTELSTLVTLLVALSVAAERLVEIVKGFVPFLNQENTDAKMEGIRKSVLQFMAVVSGILTAFLTWPVISNEGIGVPLDSWPGVFALGLLASGGSGFWNSIQTYVNKLKDVKKLQVEDQRIDVKNKKQNQAGGSSTEGLSADTRTGNP